MDYKSGTIKDFFEDCGYPYEEISENESIDISDQNIEIASYDHEQKTVVFKQVLSLVRKEDAKMWELHVPGGDPKKPLLKGTEAHRVYDPFLREYQSIKNATLVMDSKEFPREVFAIETDNIEPVLDIEVKDTGCYFSNGILSHNTTTGGNSLKFYASQRVDIRRIGAVKSGEEIIASLTKIKVVKNKVASPFKEAEIEIRYGEGIDTTSDLIAIASDMGVIEKSGAWYAYNGERLGQGKENVRTLLIDNNELRQEIWDKVMNISEEQPELVEDLTEEESIEDEQ